LQSDLTINIIRNVEEDLLANLPITTHCLTMHNIFKEMKNLNYCITMLTQIIIIDSNDVVLKV